MTTRSSKRTHVALLATIVSVGLAAATDLLQPVSTRDTSQDALAGGGGDSCAPIMTPDGRYVLFASMANNLLLPTNNVPLPLSSPPRLNVFLRDRVNGTTTLVSVNTTGVQGGNGDSFPVALSTNGNYALFESTASDLVSGDSNNASDVFLRDIVAGTTLLVSVSTNGTAGNGASRNAVMTHDGRLVAFSSAANDLVPQDTNGIADVFVRDMQAGATSLVSTGARAAGPVYGGTSSSDLPQITPDGQYVAFFSSATNLVPGVRTTSDIYVCDRGGAAIYWASSYARTALQAAQGSTNALCYGLVISTNGQFVAYQASQMPGSSALSPGLVLRYNVASGVTDLVSTNGSVPTAVYDDLQDVDMTADGRLVAFLGNTNGTGTTCVYVWDAQQNAAVLDSGNLTHGVPASSTCHTPTLDPLGRWVSFLSSAPNMVTNSLAGDYHLYLHDLQAGTTFLLDADTNGVGLPLNFPTIPCLSADGRFVAFECGDANLVPNDRNRDSDLFVRDTQTGSIELISARAASLPSLSPNGASVLSACSVSANGRFIAFASDADNLAPNVTNRFRHVFLRDLVAGTNVLVDVNTNGFAADRASSEPSISSDGRYVAFTSSADDLVAGDNNNAQDVFIRDLQSGTTLLVSLNMTGTGPGSGDSYLPILSADAMRVVFRSKALNLTSTGFAGENLFVRDLQRGTNYLLTANNSSYGVLAAAITPNGRFVASSSSGTSKSWRVWDAQLVRGVYTNVVASLLNSIAISPDGNRVAYTTSAGISARDLALATTYTVSATVAAGLPGLRFSGDSRWLAYSAAASYTNQVYLYDFLGGTNFLLSRSYDSTRGGLGYSDSPDLSADGRFVAYHSEAENLALGDTNNVPDIFLYDRYTGTTTLLSASRFGAFAAGNRSISPFFSGDGQTLVFQSWASDLVAQDFNHAADIVAYGLFASGSIPLFSALALPGATPGQQPTITWPALPGKTYQLEFKDSLSDATWQNANGGVTILGNQGFFVDPAPAAARRYYRVAAY